MQPFKTLRSRSHGFETLATVRFASIAALSVVLATMIVATATAQNYSQTGRWAWVDVAVWDSMNAGTLVSGGGTHMALLRGNADSSWVLHWHDGNRARLWLAQPMDDVGVGDHVGYTSVNTFCSGHAALSDGRLLVVGGTTVGITGPAECETFDATHWFEEPARGWREVDKTAQGHWYPTVTPNRQRKGSDDGRGAVDEPGDGGRRQGFSEFGNPNG